MRNLNKNGISPLIATVLLIGFTVALSAFVITWGGGFAQDIISDTEDQAEKAFSCTNSLKFDINKVNCNDAGTSKITIDNKGDIDIKGLVFRFFDANGDNLGVTQLDTGGPNNPTLGRFEVRPLSLYPGTVPQLIIPVGTDKVESVAILQIDGVNVTCSENPKQKTLKIPC